MHDLNSPPTRRLGFIELGDGQLGQHMQTEFEQAAITARDMNGKVTINLHLTIYPPDSDNDRFGKADYSISVKAPKYGRSLITELRDGIPVKAGNSADDLMQCKLDLGIPSNTTPLITKGARQ